MVDSQAHIQALAEEIRSHVRSQDWRVFFAYEGRECGKHFKVRDGVLFVADCHVAIRCSDGALIRAAYPPPGEEAGDVLVVNFYTSLFVYDTGLQPWRMLEVWLPV